MAIPTDVQEYVEKNIKLPDLRNRYVPSIEKAKNKLGLRLNISLAESLRHISNTL